MKFMTIFYVFTHSAKVVELLFKNFLYQLHIQTEGLIINLKTVKEVINTAVPGRWTKVKTCKRH